ncbi:MAG TPA: nucleotidyltransferase family protein [Rhizomicrobium sp.]|jgi:molybdenum cofactor cytidylyltransferase
MPTVPLQMGAAPRNSGKHGATVTAIVLAAGLSSRMGSNKLLAVANGRSVLRSAVETALCSDVGRVLVVTGNQADDVRQTLDGLPVAFVHNADFRQGLSTSLRSGIRALPDSTEAALILLGDMPGITPATLDRLIAAYAPQEGRCICVPVHDGIRGNPVLWDRRFFAEMAAIGGDKGARHLMAKYGQLVCEVESLDAGPLIDIDTPQALARWRAGHPS